VVAADFDKDGADDLAIGVPRWKTSKLQPTREWST
jgi:hypothetical protein